jgi:succinylarginine dihydrolase
MMSAKEYNFDGLVGPTHNYAGLSVGNVASLKNALGEANPREAALEGLAKMKALHDLGIPQAVLPPLERPDIDTLRRLGFNGDDAKVLIEAAKKAPDILIACSSASSMWTANACTVSPSADCEDGRVHFTPANLSNKFHRSIEHPTTGKILSAIFGDEQYFAHHPALPSGDHFGDEGAANHSRFCMDYGSRGVEFFVYGKSAFKAGAPAPTRFPARQTLEASESIARLHQLSEKHTIFAQQLPETIDAGVFHNDVIAVANRHVLFCHEYSFINQAEVYAQIKSVFPDLEIIEVPQASVSVQDAVSTYLFNSQLVNLPGDQGMVLIAPNECLANQATNDYLTTLVQADNSIVDAKIFQVQQSMKNGGGPACLRQRIVLTDAEQAAANARVFFSDSLHEQLIEWVNKHYRDSLTAADLVDPQLLIESRQALDELTTLLELGSVYPFQS